MPLPWTANETGNAPTQTIRIAGSPDFDGTPLRGGGRANTILEGVEPVEGPIEGRHSRAVEGRHRAEPGSSPASSPQLELVSPTKGARASTKPVDPPPPSSPSIDGAGAQDPDSNTALAAKKPSRKLVHFLVQCAILRPVDLLIFPIRLLKFGFLSSANSVWPLVRAANSVFGLFITGFLILEFLNRPSSPSVDSSSALGLQTSDATTPAQMARTTPSDATLIHSGHFVDTLPRLPSHIKKRCANVDAEFQACKFNFADEQLGLYVNFLEKVRQTHNSVTTLLTLLGVSLVFYSLHLFQFGQFQKRTAVAGGALRLMVSRISTLILLLGCGVVGAVFGFFLLQSAMAQPAGFRWTGGILGLFFGTDNKVFLGDLVRLWDYDLAARLAGQSYAAQRRWEEW